jgi:ubiquinone/menaquinone biosynthesis C-methylase UbiE
VLRGIDRPLPILGLDISDEMLVRAERALRSFQGYRFARADGCALPLASDCLETVCCFGGLHVIAHPERAMREMARVLRPGGLFFASILTRPGGSIGRYLSRRYVELGFLSTDFTQDQARSLLVDAGLSVSGWRLNGAMVLASARKS